jgi:PAS domain S-box-containing protein
LAPLGHILVKASSGAEALKRLLADDFALILLDVQMPEIDGLETASMIKSHTRMTSIPIIFITAISSTRERTFEGYSRGAVDYIVKPIEPEILRSKVNVFVDLYQKGEKIKLQAKLLREQQIASLERKNEERYRGLSEAVPIPIWGVRRGEVHSCNRAWAEYSGCSIDSPVGFEAPGLVHIEDLAAVKDLWERSMRNGTPFEREIRLKRAVDGAYRWHLVRGVPERPSSPASAWIVTATDIDDKKQSEEIQTMLLERERSARESAEEANRSKDEFLAMISHELRTPLNAIMGWSELLRNGGLDPTAQEKGLATIERNAKSQARLISDLLDVSRIVSGKIRLEVRPTDIEAIVRTSVESLRPAIDARGIELDLDIERLGRFMNVDANRIQQVLWNLLTNAIKFGSRRVEIALRKGPSEAVIRIADDGQGIAPDFLRHVFDRFQQADSKTTRSHGGLGLGLAIVKHIVHLHGGTVEAESGGPGKGASFEVRLPFPPIGQHTVAADGPRASTVSLKDVDVLVVDDEEDARDVMAMVLGRSGATVRTAESAADALAEVDRKAPDLLISDIGMPNEDGYELIRRVRATFSADALPAIALTAYASSIDRTRVLDAGFNAHVMKPVEAKPLLATIARVLHRESSPRDEVRVP